MALTREIVVRLEQPGQLFIANDISPLSPRYTEYTAQPAMQTVRDLLLMRPPASETTIDVVVMLPPEQITDGLDAQLTEAARRWIRVQNALEGEETGAGTAVARRMLLVGSVMFVLVQALAIWISARADTTGRTLPSALAEALSVASWVMLWFPVQAFTVEAWRSMIRRRRIRAMERLVVRVEADDS